MLITSVLAAFPALFLNAGSAEPRGAEISGGVSDTTVSIACVETILYTVRSGDAADSLRAVIVSSAARLSALDCDFVQTRESSLLEDKAVSSGHMTYRRPFFLQWEYLSPFKMKFTSDGKTVTLEKDGKIQPAGNGQNRIMREMARMIVSNIEGRALLDESMFESMVSADGDMISVVLLPKNKEMKKMWSSLVLTYDSRTMTAKSFEMSEQSGDVTTITFSNAKYEFSE